MVKVILMVNLLMSKNMKDLTKGSPVRQILSFSLPILLGMLFQQFYGVADTMIVGGTSLAVYPAAGLIDYFRGDELILINLSVTPRDREATLCIHEKIGDALSFILESGSDD